MTDTTEKIRSAWMERRNAEAQNPARVEFATSLLSELANGNPVHTQAGCRTHRRCHREGSR